MKRTIFQRITSMMLAFAMIFSMTAPAFTVHAEEAARTNLALYGEVTVDSDDNSAGMHYVITDGKIENSYWGSNNGVANAYAIVELPEKSLIDEVKVVTYYNKTDRWYTYEVLISNDQESWQSIGKYEKEVNAGNAGYSITLSEAVEAKYVKVQGLTSSSKTNDKLHLVEVEVYGTSENIVLGKTVTATGEGSSHTKEKMVDGDLTTYWSSNVVSSWTDLAEEDRPYAIIDLEGVYALDSVNVTTYIGGSRIYKYEVYTSLDGEDYTLLGALDEDSVTYFGKTYDVPEDTNARYIKVVGTYHSASTEFHLREVRATGTLVEEAGPNIQRVLEEVMTKDLVANEDYSKLILPEITEGFSLKLYATSNSAVVDLEGNITQPLEDMNVNLFYEVTSDDGESLKSDDPKKIRIEGLYDESESINEKPAVVPEIREWKGNEGSMIFNEIIVIESEELRATAEQIAMYFKEMSDIDAEIVTGTPAAGNIYLKLDADSILGEEGYAMEIADMVTVTAKTTEGILYGGTTISQILSQAEDHHSIPKGLMRDYPQYEIRSVMLDVARIYIPLEHLQEVTRYAGYFKLSEFHNHINDNNGEQSAAFRVESKLYPEINNGLDGNIYSQEDYKAYQKDAKKYGVDVVTEIDSPAHAGAFANVDGVPMHDSSHLDLRTEEAYQASIGFVKSLFDEFLDGDDPIFQNGKFHIGTDEYFKDEYSEVARRYIDELINYVNAKGYDTRFWASLGTNGFVGTTPVSTDAIAHMWSMSQSSFEEMKADGYRFINNASRSLYIVPGGLTAKYKDYLDIEDFYDNWEYSMMDRYEEDNNRYLAAGHPQLLGGEGALWYDFKVGSSEFDIFDRFRDAIVLMAEKGWYGEDDDETGADFVQRVEAVGKITPKANPARYVESETSLVAAYDFETVDNNIVKDTGSNGYDAVLNGLKVEDGVLHFDGEGYFTLPFDSLGYPYTVQFELIIDEETPENALLFEGNDGKFFYNYDGTGKFGYERKGYSYTIDGEIPTGVKLDITITCNSADTTLYMNGVEIGSGEYYKVSGAKSQSSSTFVLPAEKIGSGIYGTMDNLKLYNYTMTASEIMGENIALNKAVTVSGVEGGYAEDGVTLVYPKFDPKHATDGDTSTRISLNKDNDAWLVIDLGKAYVIDKAAIRFGELPASYAVLVSDDNENWTEAVVKTDLNGGSSSTEVLLFDGNVTARYIKYQQLEMFTASNGKNYSGNFTEFEVYGAEAADYTAVKEAIEAANALVKENYQDFSAVDAAVAAVVEGLDVTKQTEVDAFAKAIMDAITALEYKTYTVTFRTGDGFSNQLVAEVTHKHGDILEAPESKTYLYYLFEGWDADGDGNVDVKAGGVIEGITEDRTYVAVYALDPSCWYTVSFTKGSQGSIASASTQANEEGAYLVDTWVKVSAPETIHDGTEKKFAGWYKGEELVSANLTYGFYLKGDVKLTAAYAETEPEAVPAVTFSTLKRIDGYSSNPKKDRATFGITWDAPSGCTVISEGILRVYANSGKASDLVLETENTSVKNQVCSKAGRTGSYTVNCTIGNSLEGFDLYVRGYVTYRDKTGTVTTVYTGVETLGAGGR